MPHANDLETSVADWAIDHPSLTPLLEAMGIDYCCGGRSLRHACLQQNLDPVAILERLRSSIAADASGEDSL